MTSPALRAQIAQLIVVRASGHFFDSQIRYPAWEATADQLRRWLGELNIGGVILLGGTAAEVRLRTQQLQRWAATPLLIAADIEEGVGHRFPGGTGFPPPMALSAIASSVEATTLARQMGAITAREAAAIGINWLLAPVVDVNNNPENPVINVRAFGETPAQVSALATAFIAGAQAFPVLTTAKHFPGHGDTATDSHLSLPVMSHDSERLSAVELPPFQAAIAAGVDTVMSAHIVLPAWDATAPATLSPYALTHVLRQEFGFTGLVVTDALVMAGVADRASPGEVCVQALAAGADILLMPADPEVAIQAVVEAVESGRLSVEQIEQSVERLQQAKQRVVAAGQEGQRDPLDALTQVGLPEHHQCVQHILRASSGQRGHCPLPPPRPQAQNLVVLSDPLSCDFLTPQAPAIAIPESQGYHTQVLTYDQLRDLHLPASGHLLQLFIRGNPFQGRAGLSAAHEQQLKDLLSSTLVHAIVVYGSPYVQNWILQQLSPDQVLLFSYGQMPSAQEHLCACLFGSQDTVAPRDRVFI